MVGLVALGAGAVFAARGYAAIPAGGYALYLNWRFVTALAVVLAGFLYAYVMRRLRAKHKLRDIDTAWKLYVVAAAVLLVLLSVETYLYFPSIMRDDPERAKIVSRMALSIVWAVYALALLGVGFWRRIRPARLAALALFGVTALKLVIFDMSNVSGLPRIMAFMVVGALMIGASYLYHRVEKWLDAPADAESP